MDERVLQRSRAIARARVHDQAGRLVDDDQRFVLEHDVERDRLGCEGCRRRVGNDRDDDTLAAADFLRRDGRFPVDTHLARVDP